jgi:hypothetical protein
MLSTVVDNFLDVNLGCSGADHEFATVVNAADLLGDAHEPRH